MDNNFITMKMLPKYYSMQCGTANFWISRVKRYYIDGLSSKETNGK